MAISTRDGLIAAVAAGGSRISFNKATINSAAGFWYTLFRSPGTPGTAGAAPATTGVALSSATVGAIAIPSPSNTSYITSFQGVSSIAGMVALSDRLVEFGGLSGTVTTAQSVSALALPARATGATDVELWLETYTAMGSTASPTVTASYTNSSGTSGHTATLIGGIPTAGGVVNRSYPFTLQAGDTGVQSVQSLTSTASTTTAGNIGLVLRRTLLMAPVLAANVGFALGWAETDLQILPDAACVEILCLASTSTTGTIMGAFGVSQG